MSNSPVAVGEERHELPVGRDFGALFRALPIREARELGVGERDYHWPAIALAAVSQLATAVKRLSTTTAMPSAGTPAARRRPMAAGTRCAPVSDSTSRANARSRAD